MPQPPRSIVASFAAYLSSLYHERKDDNDEQHKANNNVVVAPLSKIASSLRVPIFTFHPTFCENAQRRMFEKSLSQQDEDDEDEDKEDEEQSETAAGDKHVKVDEASAKPAFPNFSRHGKNALLPKFLTEDVYRQLCNLKTVNGVTLEDLMRAGTALPWGAKPPRGLAGIYAGDADSYRVFEPLLAPLIKYHHFRQRQQRKTKPKHARLQRHQSNLNPQYLLSQRLDPDGEYILYTRMRLARSIEGFRFAPCMSRRERRQIEDLLKDCVKDWKRLAPSGSYKSVMEMSNSQIDDLVQRRLLFPNPDEFALSAGFGRDWPDGRGVYYDDWADTPSIIIWCNAQDHIWVISNAKGGDVQGVFAKLSQAVWSLETSLKQRQHSFIEDRRWGFLNTSPDNIGTALRASVYLKLPRLSRKPGFFDLIRRLRLEVRSDYSQTDHRTNGIYDIANTESLGKTEVDLINIMIHGVGVLIDLEKRLESGEDVNLDEVAV